MITCLLDHNTIDSCRPLWPAAIPDTTLGTEWFSPALAPLAIAILLALAALILQNRH